MIGANYLADRLPFEMPSFTRFSWVSERARAAWEPRVRAVSQAWDALMLESVWNGTRDACLTHVRPENFPAVAADAADRGLIVLPMQRMAVYQGFSHKHPPVVADRPWMYYVAYGRARAARDLAKAEAAGDARAAGLIMGYPLCCVDAFVERWKSGHVDMIWAAAEATFGMSASRTRIGACLPACNDLLRYASLRLVHHMPCRFDCQATAAVAARLWRYRIAEREMADEILGWPMEWSALHGIAEIRTPVFRLAANTIPTRHEWVVRLTSDTYPPEGARGVRYPYLVGNAKFADHLRRAVDAVTSGSGPNVVKS